MEKNYITFELYTKGKNNHWYCDYYFYNGERYERGTTRATGYGYDKHSTALSNAINKFKKMYVRYGKNAKKYTSYGLEKDGSISYGIGVNAVLNCLKCFKNVKIIEWHEGRREDFLKIEVITND